jgi:hypothetical protein
MTSIRNNDQKDEGRVKTHETNTGGFINWKMLGMQILDDFE